MEFVSLIIFAGLSLFVIATEPNGNVTNRSKNDSIGRLDGFPTPETHRKGKRFPEGEMHVPFPATRTRRIIKIPSNVSKLRFIETFPVEGSVSWKRFPFPDDAKWQEDENDEDYPTEETLNSIREKNYFRRNWIDRSVHDENENGDHTDEHGNTNGRPIRKKQNKPKKFSNYEGDFQHGDGFEKFTENGNAILKNIRNKGGREDCRESYNSYQKYSRPQMQSRVSSMSAIPFDFVRKPIFRKYYYDPNHAATAFFRGKGRKSITNPHYTTHNPHVATNFGLTDYANSNNYRFLSAGQREGSMMKPTFGKMKNYDNSIAAATDQIVKRIPPKIGEPFGYSMNPSRLTNQPYYYQPQGRNLSQRATLKDILDQDCPEYEVTGFCESPPRYPMHQIEAILKKCWKFMEVMGTQNLLENQDFSRRSDSNNTVPMEFDFDRVTTPKRTPIDGVPACQSQFTFVEPGYAREVTAGKWYVIVQDAETAQQRIATDTCLNPGKPCDGLTQMQCENLNNRANRSTKCIQRFAYHRLISWDPDSPDSCPRMRIFKFPSACVCHVGTTSFP